MRMEARRAKTCRKTGLGLRQPALQGMPKKEHPNTIELHADRAREALNLGHKDHTFCAMPSRRQSRHSNARKS
ncbi:hypothetical protein D3C86_1797210 [compost metagenome]